MKTKILVTLALLLCSEIAVAENVSGRVIDADSKSPIAYVNVGVVGKTLGTLTDTLGRYSLDIPLEMMNDTLRISCIGYDAVSQSVKSFGGKDIFLTRNPIRLVEINVLPVTVKRKTIGRKTSRGLFNTEVQRKSAGTEIGIRVNAKKRAWVNSVGFSIALNQHTCRFMKFRINIYRKYNNDYESLLQQQIVAEYKKEMLKDGIFTIKLPEKVMLEGEGLVALEFLEDIKNDENFIMPTTMMKGKTYFRKASQDTWKSVPVAVPIFVEADFEK